MTTPSQALSWLKAVALAGTTSSPFAQVILEMLPEDEQTVRTDAKTDDKG